MNRTAVAKPRWFGVAAGMIALVGLPRSAAAQASGEAYLAGTVSRLTSPVGSGRLAGLTIGFGVGSPTLVIGPELILQSGDSLRVRGFGLTVRARQAGRWIQPHLVVGLGAYAWQRLAAVDSLAPVPARRWREVRYLSGALGVGTTVGPWRGSLTGVIEARAHRNLTQQKAEGSRSLVGLEVGLRIAW